MEKDLINYSQSRFDYSLTGVNAKLAIESGLAEADWYKSNVGRTELRQLLTRKNGPAIKDTLILIAVLVSTAIATIVLWGTWWVVIPYLIYAVFYGTSSDSRWHECGHGTAFRTDWMNTIVYEAASFMVMRESVVWRWSHTRHHSDTIVVGRDPEIQIPRPPNISGLILSLINFGGYKTYFPSLARHALGKVSASEKTFIPDTEFYKMFRNSRIIIAIYVLVIGSAFVIQSWIPIFLFILPQAFGTWLMIVHNTTQHAGLAENVLDHRLNTRTVYMNPISRFIYWNMNYHIEHHMYPLVPYHALPELHKLIKDDCPPVYTSIYSAWKEIIPTIIKQVKNPAYHVTRKLPDPKEQYKDFVHRSDELPDSEGWIKVFAASDLEKDDVLRFDHIKKTYAIYRDMNGVLYASDGICTHGNTHLAEGMLNGNLIECSKHNGRFKLEDGSPARAPICRGLVTYPIEERGGGIYLNINKPGGAGTRPENTYKLRVVSNNNLATFIKELVVEPVEDHERIEFTPGDYLQVKIPVYKELRFNEFDISEPYAEVWRDLDIFNLTSRNTESDRRNNYSIAGNLRDRGLKFNVRISTPPPGIDCPPGIGSSYIFSLKPGDTLTAFGPYGDFHIKPTKKEMVYIGGGAGMAPIRAHITQLLENDSSLRKISYWFGARSKKEIFYEDYFRDLASRYSNFNFEIALSDPLVEGKWTGNKGFIHEIVYESYLKDHPDVKAIEFYLCGPPAMISACNAMLNEIRVTNEQISFDEF